MISRLKNEPYLSFVERCNQALSDGEIGYEEWGNLLIGKSLYEQETIRRCSVFLKQFMNCLTEDNEQCADLSELAETYKKERMKLQDENRQYNANMRSEARSELLQDKIVSAIAQLEPIQFKKVFESQAPCECEGVLCISDAHNGVEVNMTSLFGEVVNLYNPQILKARLEKLLCDVVNDKEKYLDYSKLTVFDLGDAIQGILRLSDIAKLKTGVVESALGYAEMIAQWLTKLSDELNVKIDYYCLGGNHCELRLLGGKHGDFPEENIGKIIREFIALRLKDNPNITIAPYAECAFKTIQGVNVLAYHGDDAQSDAQEIAFWENYHQVDIDLLIEGHLHHKEENSVGYALNGGDKEVVHIPSLIGCDAFSKKCRKLSRAGAKFMLFEDGCKTWERTYILN